LRYLRFDLRRGDQDADQDDENYRLLNNHEPSRRLRRLSRQTKNQRERLHDNEDEGLLGSGRLLPRGTSG
jgi:hypothetical protein